MKKLITLCALIFSTVVLFAQKSPKIEFSAANNTLDFGKVVKGMDNGVRTVEFKNTGDYPLLVYDVRTSCGCVVASTATAPIKPGKSGKIEVKYNMNLGRINRQITLQTNAVNYEKGMVTLKLTGEVVEK